MKKNFVLDTNVLLYDSQALLSFEDNNVIIPIYVIEEIDNFKKGLSELGRNARQVSRILDDLRGGGLLTDGVEIPESSGGTLRVAFADGGPELVFRDARKFGKVLLLRPGQRHARLAKLGVDALEASGAGLFDACRKRTAWIKTVLLDQSVLAGVGNIYADEALFLSGIRPNRRAARLTRRQCDVLVRALRRVMLDSIQRGGTTVSDYLNADGRRGSYQTALRVYGRAGEPCPKCGSPIVRRSLNQRSAHYCRHCQT